MNQERLLNPLPYPVYFVCQNFQKWEFLTNNEMPPPIEQLADRLIDANDVWSVQTYIYLKRRGLQVYLVPNYVRGRICVTTYDRLTIKDFPFNSYVVACQHERARPEICEKRIVQNQLNVFSRLFAVYFFSWRMAGDRAYCNFNPLSSRRLCQELWYRLYRLWDRCFRRNAFSR
jgi:hypothetical protein